MSHKIARLVGKDVIVSTPLREHDVRGILGLNGDYVVISGTNVSFHCREIASVQGVRIVHTR
jgi:hypothetical protein